VIYPLEYVNETKARTLLLGLFGVSNIHCNQIFEQASKVDDYEFNLHQRWKDEEDRTGFDSKQIGGFSNW
jgi:hypothetical protein